MSGSSLRPKPPPIRWLCTVTFSSGNPVSFATVRCTRADDLRAEPHLAGVRLQLALCSSSAPSSRARGTAARRLPRTARRESVPSPRLRGFGDRAALRTRGTQFIPDVCGGDGSVRARRSRRWRVRRAPAWPPTCDRPRRPPCHRARPPCEHPESVFAALSSTWPTLPPSTGLAARVANFIPGSITSMP